MHSLTTGLVDLVLGRVCAGCEEPGSILCLSCEADLRPRPRWRRDLDLTDLVAGLRIPVACALDYRGSVRNVLFRYKDHGIRGLANALAPALGASIEYLSASHPPLNSDPILVPIPTRRVNRRRRGFDHIRLLAKTSTIRSRGLKVSSILRDTRSDQGSKRLGAADREVFASGAFTTTSGLPSPQRSVFVVDDIVTTGATAREAVATLLLAGVHVAGVATVAGTP